jgi:hypothetical protein
MGVDEQGLIWAQRVQIWTLIFFIFEKQFWLSAGTADMKNDLFYILRIVLLCLILISALWTP